MDNKVMILDSKQIGQKISRLAWQLYEDNAEESELVVAGIRNSGYRVAEKIADEIRRISPLRVVLAEVRVDKHADHPDEVQLSVKAGELKGKAVVLVDDVLNSGKTMMYALRPFLLSDLKKLRTVVLVDRNHRRYPVAADFAGLTLSTTLQEHVSVELEKEREAVYLS